VPGAVERAFGGLDGYGPVTAASPDTGEIGAVSGELCKDLGDACQIEVLLVADEGKVLADGEEG